ncbi:MAG: preprotein translocase subunit SecA [Patescibacteria group bacterium]|nr:preprotein translocase subunit SecA [Patescibacteria group bacterium]MEA2113470.1 preprotein translocase subunit SecA [Patescibacteria group bacterium]
MSIFSKIFGGANEKRLKDIEPLIEKINGFEPQFTSIPDGGLKDKTAEFKERFKNGETLDGLLPEAFALAREASKRALGQRPFDVQLIGGIVLHQGRIAEMKTGEGKTLASVLAAYLNALPGKGVHIVTVNDYLSRRDANWMGPIFHLMGISVACLNHEKSYVFEPQAAPDKNEVTVEMENLKEVPRKEAYLADITYGTNNEFGFDYLRDNMAPSLEMIAQREPHFAIVDEIDSILIDEARTPLIISMPDAESTKMYEQFCGITPQLKENADYNLDEKMKAVTLTENGINRVEKILGMGNIYEEGGIRYVHHLEQALRAEVIFKKDRDYVVKEGQVIIVDEFTGRLMPGRRYSDGLHQALEAKEKVRVQQESRTLASITFQNYFRMYEKLSGMTGTAITSAEEFDKVYNLKVVEIPTNKPAIRRDASDSIYKNEKGKFQAIVRDIKKRHQAGQPVLVGTVSIEKNELLSAYLQKEGIAHQILNAKNHEQEAQILAQAGKKGAVTVATNMAGRGVDIILGGRDLEDSEKEEKHNEVVKLGGLHVIGTERHEARRIDDQLRGRAGRQGDPGSSQFFVSLEDDLMRVFGGDKVKSMMEILKVPDDQPLENKLVSKAIESAQGKIEGYNLDARKHILEYDDVMNKQRETVYKKRKEVLGQKDVKSEVIEMLKNEIKEIVQSQFQLTRGGEVPYKEISEIIESIFQASELLPQKKLPEVLAELRSEEEVSDYLIKLAEEAYQKKEKEIEEENMRRVEKYVLLRSLDTLWMDHLDNMEHLRDSVRLRAYGQRDPLVEYKNEGIRLFKRLIRAIQSTVVNMIYKVSISPNAPVAREVHGMPMRQSSGAVPTASGVVPEVPKATGAKVRRNDPCPCGSGKKFKKCCMGK